MRYVVIEYVTGKYHPYMPYRRLFACKDLKNNTRSMGVCTNFQRMKDRVDEKNKESLKDIKIFKTKST